VEDPSFLAVQADIARQIINRVIKYFFTVYLLSDIQLEDAEGVEKFHYLERSPKSPDFGS
jgi:hypothetical protein